MNLLNGVDTTNSTQVSAVNAQTSKVQSQTLNTVNHDATLAAQTVGADGTTGVADRSPRPKRLLLGRPPFWASVGLRRNPDGIAGLPAIRKQAAFIA